ncbi:MAG TPA: hypothetical protein VGM30_17610 [Puia sp.]
MRPLILSIAFLFIMGCAMGQSAEKTTKQTTREPIPIRPLPSGDRSTYRPATTVTVNRKPAGETKAAPALGGEGSGIIPIEHKPKILPKPTPPKPKPDSTKIYH